MSDDQKSVWVLRGTGGYNPVGPSWWVENGKYPHPMGFAIERPKIFATRREAEDFIFDHIRRGRDVSFCEPLAIRIKMLRKILGEQ